MAIVLDLAAALMANGKSGTDLDEENRGSCTGCSQIFIAYDPYLFGSRDEIQEMLDKRVAAADSSHPEEAGRKVSCPGERTIQARRESMEKGIQVNKQIWEQVKAIADGNMDITDISAR